MNDDEIKNALIIREEKELEDKIKSKRSLGVIRIIGRQTNGEKYTKILREEDRKVIAEFRLGTYRWKTPKNKEGERICLLCNGTEGVLHWMNDCPGLTEIGKKWRIEGTAWNTVWKVQFSLYLSPVLHLTYIIPSDPNWLNFDSSENITFLQSARV